MQLNTINLLIVDAAATMRSSLAHQMEMYGFGKVIQARDHTQALKILQQEPVHVVVSELSPPTDGLALLESVRGLSSYASVPIVLTSAALDRELARRAIAAGAGDLLIKPFTTKRLVERVTRLLASDPARSNGMDTASSELAAPERATLLVVDDTPENLQLLAGLFRDRFKVKLATNGEKALSICQSDSPPDLVLLDVMMPDMDGFDVVRQMREHHACSHTPVIFVTAMNDDESRRKGLDLGAIDYVFKPIEPDLLQLRVSNLMQFVEFRKQMQADFDLQREIAGLRQEVERLRGLLKQS